jgi:UDP-glucose 4-epimerase
VSGLLRVGRSATASGVLNIATGRLTTVRRFAEQAAEIMGIPGDRLRFGAEPKREGEMFHDAVDTSRAEQLLGWFPTISIADGVSRTWELERN